jgi:hypothetical protein
MLDNYYLPGMLLARLMKARCTIELRKPGALGVRSLSMYRVLLSRRVRREVRNRQKDGFVIAVFFIH